MSKTVVLTGGGTAGHIYPALALAEEMRSRGWDVRYAGTPEGIEARIVPDAGFPFKGFPATGFDRAHPSTLVSGVTRVLKSTRRARKWFADIRPDVVVGFGGYVSIPVARAAEELGVPVVVHEQNSVMGMANRYIAKKARAICLTYGEAASSLGGSPYGEVVVTGNPVRSSVVTATREEGRAMLGIPADATMLLVFGGSRGARHINEAVASMKDELLAIEGLFIVHITGPKELESVQRALALTEAETARWRVMGYQDSMAETLAAADLIVSRAGATSLAEIAARCTPAILVPYPHATGDHQTVNAKSYASGGAAQIIADDLLDASVFRESVVRLATDEAARSAMRDAASASGAKNAVFLLADIVEKSAGDGAGCR